MRGAGPEALPSVDGACVGAPETPPPPEGGPGDVCPGLSEDLVVDGLQALQLLSEGPGVLRGDVVGVRELLALWVHHQHRVLHVEGQVAFVARFSQVLQAVCLN